MYKKRWTDEQEKFALSLMDLQDKTKRKEIFDKAFPENNFSKFAISTKICELRRKFGIKMKFCGRSVTKRPLYSEQIKKGYIKIKVSNSEWWEKQKWVWVCTHPGESFNDNDIFVFLDCNNRNFLPENILKVDHRIVGIVNRNRHFKRIPGAPEYNKLLYLRAALSLRLLDLGEDVGIVAKRSSGRYLLSVANRRQKKYRLQRKLRGEK